MIRAAADLIARDGVAGTTIGDVLAATGASRGSVYYYFPGGRSELMTEGLRFGGEAIGVDFNAARRLPLPEAMPALVDVWRRRVVESGYTRGCPVAAGVQARATDPDVADVADEILLQWTRLLAARLREEGADDDAAADGADEILTAIEGAVVVSRSRCDAVPFDRVARRLGARFASRSNGAAEEGPADLRGADAARPPLG